MTRRPGAGDIAFVPDWPAPPGVQARQTLRGGGVSSGAYASLNVGGHVGDAREAVAANRRRLVERLGLPAEPVWLEQVHGRRVLHLGAKPRRAASGGPAETAAGDRAAAPAADRAAVPAADRAAAPDAGPTADPAAAPIANPTADSTAAPEAALTADGAVTSCRGVVCAVMTADCLPVLFCDKRGRGVGVAHAGWRGLAGGVLPAAVDALAVPPADVLAWLGPAIGPGAFEVGGEVRDAFAAAGFDTDSAFRRNARGRWQADLYALARQSLNRAGVESIHGGGACTYTDEARFFSHRREAPCGRMATLIWLE